MNKYSDIRKKYTEAPLVDEIVYECQQIIKGIVLKDEERANNAETLKSIKDSDLYASIIHGTYVFESFNYTYDLFMKIPYMSSQNAIRMATKQLEIPDSIKPQLMELAKEKWLKTFEESNNYYRMLWGKPDYGEPDIMLTQEEIDMIPYDYFDTTKYICEYNNNEIDILYSCGAIDSLLVKYPNRQYLKYLGERSIDPYKARRTAKFGLLYMPSVDNAEVSNKFKERFEINRVYILKTVYSEAYHYGSDYYDRIMMMLIVLETFNDMIVYSPEYIIDRELFDLRTIQYLFEACGVDFYEEIPLKYQKRLIKNLNRLIKYKSSDKCLVDIVSLFGFNNMKLFEYYLLKTPVVNEDGSYRHDTYEDPKTGEELPNLESNYKLKFVKVPIDGIPTEYLDDPMNMVDYDEITADDIYWNGVYTKDYVKHTILEREFSLRDSKYLSIETLYSLTEMQFQMVYFMNMLMYSDIDMSDLLVEVPEISMTERFPLVDLLIMLFSLMYLYNGTKDNIIYNPVQAMDICGFNFETDLSELATYVVNAGYTLEDVGLDIFKNPKSVGIHTWEKLFETYNDNISVYKFLIKQMNNANDKDEYDLYKKVFEALYVTKLNFGYFKKYSLNKKAPDTYSKFLSNKGSILYGVIHDCKSITKDSDRQNEVSRIINFVVEDIYCYINKDEFQFIFQNIPTINTDYVRQYLYKILNFFKSYKTDFIRTNILYKFDDRLDNKIMIIDKILFSYLHTWTDEDKIYDKMTEQIHVNPTDRVFTIEDKIYLDIVHWILMHFDEDKVNIEDEFFHNISFEWKEYANIVKDIISEFKYVYTKADHVNILEDTKTNISLTMKDTIPFDDNEYREYYYI